MRIIKVEFSKIVTTVNFVKCDDCGYVFKHMDNEEYAHCLRCDSKCRTKDLKYELLGGDK